jgi:hypothetical protein
VPAPQQPGYAPPHLPRFGGRRYAYTAVGGLAPPPTEIPLLWLSQPLALRMEPPYNEANVNSVYAADQDSIDEYGANPFDATLAGAIGDDAGNLATWTVNRRADPRMRVTQLTVDLLYRTDTERQLLLSVRRNRRVRITGVPPEFPEGADSLIVTGITHEIGETVRRIHFTTQAVVGTTPGVPGPWFRLGTSALGGTDLVPF